MREVRCVTLGLVGGVTVEDVAAVSDGRRVEFEEGTLDKLKRMAPKQEPQREPLPELKPPEYLNDWTLSTAESRAGAFVRLATLVHGKSAVRVEVFNNIQTQLNAASFQLPAAPTDALLLDALASRMPEPPLWQTERLALLQGSCYSAGIGGLMVHHSRLLLSVANASAALSCEALGASTKTLDAQRLESCANKNAQEAAEIIRSLITGSKRINDRKSGVGIIKGIGDLPSIHGAAVDAIEALHVSLRSELNAQALDVKSLDEYPNEISPTFFSRLEAAAKSTMEVLGASLLRCHCLLDRLPELKPSMEPPEADALNEKVQATKTILGVEVSALMDRRMVLKEQLRLLLNMDDPLPGAGVAVIGYAMLKALSRSLALECLLSFISLQIVEGPPTQTDQPEASQVSTKKEKKRKGAGPMLGQGTTAVRIFLLDHFQCAIDHDTEEVTPWPSLITGEGVTTKWLSSSQKVLSMDTGTLPEIARFVQTQIEMHQIKRKPKIPKGTRDFLPDQMRIRQTMFDTITAVFKRHGAVSIDTPVFELKETLTGKYGEDSKLIYDLADQGGEILALRYDLTVPFARYVALNSVGNIKRYHIGKVYRRDQPQMTKGRFREFFQCDFDIAGNYATMIPDAECVKVLVEILKDLNLGPFEVKINHRRLIDAMMDICGVPVEKHRAICSAIDKLDKEPWDIVKAEMVMEKGLETEVADRLGTFVQIRDAPDVLLRSLMDSNHPFQQHPEASAALKEMEILVTYLEKLQATEGIIFDLSLARGLDYYSGLIYEAVFKGASTGSVAAGGRYDKLVGMFSGKDVPAVGVSIGVERVFSIMEKKMKEAAEDQGTIVRTNDTQVLVASIGNGLQMKRMELCARLWSAGIAAEFGYKPNPKMGDNFDYALQEGIPYMVLFGEDELKQGLVKIKNLTARTEETVSNDDLVSELSKRLEQS